MELIVVRNKKQVDELCEQLKSRRIPFKIAVDDIYPGRSLDMNAYYFGIVLKYIADESGQSLKEVHEGYKKLFNFRGDLQYNSKTNNYEIVMEVCSTTVLNNKEFLDYVFKVRADGEMEHHIVIPLPNECFIPSLDFDHDKIETRRI